MQRGYCPECHAARPFRRAFGWGTFFAVIITGGLWLIALPFYPKRCRECGGQWSAHVIGNPQGPQRRERRTIADWGVGDWVLAVGAVAIVVMIAFGVMTNRFL